MRPLLHTRRALQVCQARRALFALLLALLGLTSLPAHAADVFIVVHVTNPVKSMSIKEALDLYTGRSRSFIGGEPALVFDLPRDGSGRAALYQALTGMSLVQVNSFWSRLTFTGQKLPPQALSGEAAMVEIVKHNPAAIGYLTAEPNDPALRVVLTLRSGANSS